MKNDLSWNDPWLRSPWNTVWAYLSFLSEPRIQAYITYLKSPFWLNINTWTEEVFSLKDFCNQWGCCPFSSAKILDKSFTCLEWIFKCVIGQSKKWKRKKKRKNDSRVKTRKGSLEEKRENFLCLMDKANRRMKGQWSDSIRSLYEVFHPFRNQNLNSSYLPSNSRVYHGGSWHLSNCHIQEQQKWIFLRCLIFK